MNGNICKAKVSYTSLACSAASLEPSSPLRPAASAPLGRQRGYDSGQTRCGEGSLGYDMRPCTNQIIDATSKSRGFSLLGSKCILHARSPIAVAPGGPFVQAADPPGVRDDFGLEVGHAEFCLNNSADCQNILEIAEICVL